MAQIRFFLNELRKAAWLEPSSYVALFYTPTIFYPAQINLFSTNKNANQMIPAAPLFAGPIFLKELSL